MVLALVQAELVGPGTAAIHRVVHILALRIVEQGRDRLLLVGLLVLWLEVLELLFY